MSGQISSDDGRQVYPLQVFPECSADLKRRCSSSGSLSSPTCGSQRTSATSQLRLRLNSRQQQITDVAGRLVEVVAHLVAALALGDDVEVEAVQNVSCCP